MEPFRMIIGGELVNGVSTLPVINPATEASIADCPRADESQLDQAVAAANSAFNGWAATPIAERRAALMAVADEMEAKITAEVEKRLSQKSEASTETSVEQGPCFEG